MKFIITKLVLIAIISSIPVQVFAQFWDKQDFLLETRIYDWTVQPQGDFQVDSVVSTGTRIDLEDDLGMEQKDNSINAEFKFNLNDIDRIQLNLCQIKYENSQVLPRNIIYEGKLYGSGETLSSKMVIQTIDLHYKGALLDYDFFEDFRFDGGFSVGANYIRLDFTLDSPVTNRTIEKLNLPYPAGGLFANLYFYDKARLSVLANGTKINFQDANLTMFDFKTEISAEITESFAVFVGYRKLTFNAEIKIDTNEYDKAYLQLEGLFAGFSFIF